MTATILHSLKHRVVARTRYVGGSVTAYLKVFTDVIYARVLRIPSHGCKVANSPAITVARAYLGHPPSQEGLMPANIGLSSLLPMMTSTSKTIILETHRRVEVFDLANQIRGIVGLCATRPRQCFRGGDQDFPTKRRAFSSRTVLSRPSFLCPFGPPCLAFAMAFRNRSLSAIFKARSFCASS